MKLFVGIRLKPFEYGVPCNGYILKYDGKGNLTDITDQVAPELKNIGMIRDMTWADVNGDGYLDMIIVRRLDASKVFIMTMENSKKKKMHFQKTQRVGGTACLLVI